MNPEPDSIEAMLALLRAAQSHFAGREEELRAEGIEPGGFLEECDALPPERWARLSPETGGKIEELLAQWRVDRETILGSLPIEDRRRLEAMHYEDFENPGSSGP